LWEEQAALFFAREGERLARTIPDASLKVYPESDHAVHWERTERIVRDLEGFIKGPEFSEFRSFLITLFTRCVQWECAEV
jgi:hypothetical protein